MGILSDLIVADRQEADAILAESHPSKRWERADVKGLDSIKLGTLMEILSGEKIDPATFMTDALAQASDEGPWVFLLPESLVKALTIMDETDESITERWAQTEEFVLDRLTAAEAEEYLQILSDQARKAQEAGKDLLLWMSL